MRVWSMAVVAVLLGAPATVRAQQVVNIDLGGSAQTLSQSGAAGTSYRFILLNAIPGQRYEVRVEERILRPDPLPTPTIDLAGLQSGCEQALTLAQALPKQANEADVKKSVDAIEGILATNNCDATTVAETTQMMAATVVPVQGTYLLRAGTELLVTVTRGDRKWTQTISAGERGVWLTTFGVGIVPKLNDRIYLAKDGDTYIVTPVGDEDGAVAVPSVMYHWLPTAAMTRNFSFSITGGLGVSKDRPAFILGGGVAYNWNLMLFGGLGVVPHLVRRPEYTDGRVLAEKLTEDQLHERSWKPSFIVGGSFRFGGNPFKSE